MGECPTDNKTYQHFFSIDIQIPTEYYDFGYEKTCN